MPLKTVVKVGNISNLSDARYCAGMGVDMLGFCVIEGKPGYLSPKLYQEIRGWISGPKVVAEIYGLQSTDQLADLIQNYAPDYLELTSQEFKTFGDTLKLPCIVRIDGPGRPVKTDNTKIAYLISDKVDTPAASKSVLLEVNSKANLIDNINKPQVAGIVLNGSPEVRPGFKNYDELSEILELLDE
jgi:phosphoribosylanthranilate isomerase